MPSGQYFETDPAVSSRPGEVDVDVAGFRARLMVDRGVFAAGGVDAGTLALLKAIPPPPAGGDLLDLGCGYGPIACALAHRSPGAVVWAVDINQRALDLTARNARALGLAGVRAVPPTGVPETVRFAGMWSNPPIRAGKAALHDLLAAWLPRLEPGATAWLVVHRHLGGDSLAAWLAGEGWRVSRAGSKRGYRILGVESAA
ncbi:MAG: class I SAM-dependent methyltransferase [Acidimicrobiales bacterium]